MCQNGIFWGGMFWSPSPLPPPLRTDHVSEDLPRPWCSMQRHFLLFLQLRREGSKETTLLGWLPSWTCLGLRAVSRVMEGHYWSDGGPGAWCQATLMDSPTIITWLGWEIVLLSGKWQRVGGAIPRTCPAVLIQAMLIEHLLCAMKHPGHRGWGDEYHG